MDTIPEITDEDVRARVGEQSFQRGRQYFRSGAIFSQRRQDMTLKARCRGSSADSYRVEVTFDPRGIAQAECSCPVGDGGYCKHIAALLLTWLDEPAAFGETESVDAALERRSRAELIVLIKHMLRRQPDLELLVETPLPTPGVRQRPVNPASYRRQAAAAFRHGGNEWGSETSIAEELQAIVEAGDAFAAQGDHANAAVVYQAVSDTVIEKGAMYEDEEGELGEVITSCVDGLGRCLAAVRDEAARAGMLQSLFDVYHHDVELGGIGLGDAVPELVEHYATDEEKQTMAGWIREVLAGSSDWSRQQYGGFLLELEGEALDDEAFLQLCRETGRTADAVERLLQRGRLDEAVAMTEGVSDYEMLTLATLFTQHGYGSVAERLMLERSRKTSDVRVLDWLKSAYLARDNHAAALDLARRIFRMTPSLNGYKEVQALAEALDRWEAVRPALRMFLNESHQTRLLVEIYLYEGEIDHALEAMQALAGRTQGYGYYGFDNTLLLDVARAAEETRPRAALDIYRREAEGLIALQGRDRYRAACTLLKKVRALHHTLAEDAEWAHYIAQLREQNRRLRALMEELATAKL